MNYEGGKKKEEGKELVKILDWVLEGSNDGEQFDGLFLATNAPIKNETQFFSINTDVGPERGYLYYRFLIKRSSSPGPGISYFQLFPLCEII